MSWRVQKTLVLVSMLVLCVASLFYAAGGNPNWNDRKGMTWLLAARVAIGPNMIFGTFLRMAAQQVTMPSENVSWNMVFSLGVTLGTGLGPLVSPIFSWCIGAEQVRNRSAASAYVFSVIWGYMLIFCAVCLPSDMRPILDEVRRRRGEDLQRSDEPLDMPDHQRRSIWWSGVWFTAERSFIIAALEAATVFVLEEEFDWSAQRGGFAVGASFLATLPFTLVLLRMKAKKLARDTTMLQCVVFIGAIVTVMFFPVAGARPALVTTLLLVTDCIVFSTGFAADGLMNGFATSYCEGPESFFSTSNYILATQFIRVMPRFLSPIVSRYLLSAHGRAMYAGVQLLMSSLGCLTCFHVAATIQAHRESSEKKKASSPEAILPAKLTIPQAPPSAEPERGSVSTSLLNPDYPQATASMLATVGESSSSSLGIPMRD
eukprot:CAMPEP_0169090486 /NCGR_PEP_ID=MMETSP1015-20121227/15846_1 /TAXON_ID=342587 /ORGANISM="Karlodinium micrum, Strain CCMP2283" /LENGTH=430 /DNA_ID=CAMNT_0009150897 /DNA_START=468 /DNA_END=1760 /DNA_ORIENTATION=-